MSLNRLLAPVITAVALTLQSGCPKQQLMACPQLQEEVRDSVSTVVENASESTPKEDDREIKDGICDPRSMIAFQDIPQY